MKHNKTLILLLAVRGGGANYTYEVVKQIKLDKYFISPKNSEIGSGKSDEYWITHKTFTQFIIYSVVLLPIYVLRIISGIVSKKYNKLYLPNFHFWNIIFIMLFKIFGKEVIVTVHDGSLQGKNGVPVIQRLANLCMIKATKLIFLTNYVKELTLKSLNGLSKKPVFVIPHGIIYPPGIITERIKLSKKPVILFFGRVLKSKGVDELIEAVSLLDAELYDKLLIVGKQSYQPNIKANLNIEIIDDFIPEGSIADYFNSADILVLPYQEASQSGVLTIGIGAAIPMVVTQGSGLSEQLNENEGVFIQKDPISIKDGLLQLINNPTRYQSISAALSVKQKKLTWENISKTIESVIKS